MNERETIVTTVKTRRRWKFWAFIVINVAGVVVAIPLLMAVGPLVSVWWDTRSQESFKRHEELSTRLPAKKAVQVSDQSRAGNSDSPNGNAPSFAGLTNNLKLIGNLNEGELDKIVTKQYGKQKPTRADPATFDRDSAVFHAIDRSVATLNGKQYFCYKVDLVDENGNHNVNVDTFEKPDLDYERSMAALELMNSNPQLKKIYKAFSRVLAEQSSSTEKTGAGATVPKQAVHLGKDTETERP